jgi:hypothetical protein
MHLIVNTETDENVHYTDHPNNAPSRGYKRTKAIPKATPAEEAKHVQKTYENPIYTKLRENGEPPSVLRDVAQYIDAAAYGPGPIYPSRLLV